MFVFARHSAWKFTILELHLNPGRGLNSRPMKSTLLAVSVHRSDHLVMLLAKEDNSRFISILFFTWAVLTCSTTLPRGNAVSPTTSCYNFNREIARKIGIHLASSVQLRFHLLRLHYWACSIKCLSFLQVMFFDHYSFPRVRNL